MINNWLFNEDTVDRVIAHLMENGLKVETNKVKQMKVVFFNADALSPDDSGVVVTPYLGVGPRILRLID